MDYVFDTRKTTYDTSATLKKNLLLTGAKTMCTRVSMNTGSAEVVSENHNARFELHSHPT